MRMSTPSASLSSRRQPETFGILRLGKVAATEVERLRGLRRELLVAQAEIARELKTISDLITIYTSFDPSLARPEDNRSGASRRRLGATLRGLLEAHRDEWMTLSELVDGFNSTMRGIEAPDPKALRNALYHLRKTEQSIQSRTSEGGLEYRFVSPIN